MSYTMPLESTPDHVGGRDALSLADRLLPLLVRDRLQSESFAAIAWLTQSVRVIGSCTRLCALRASSTRTAARRSGFSRRLIIGLFIIFPCFVKRNLRSEVFVLFDHPYQAHDASGSLSPGVMSELVDWRLVAASSAPNEHSTLDDVI